MQLYFVRHGKTQWNLERKFQGREGNSPLLLESYQEIAQLGIRLNKIHFEKVYCSTSLRARETALGIMKQAKKVAPIVYTDDLRELGLGNLEGANIDIAEQEYPDELGALRYFPAEYNPTLFHGESIESVIKRTVNVVFDALETNQKGPLLFVGHGAALTAAVQTLSGQELANIRSMGGLSNDSLSVLSTEKGFPFSLELWNDTTHLTNS